MEVNLVNNSTSNGVNSLYFPNQTTGYAVCDNGVIEKSIDGGNNWFLMTSGTTNMLMSVYFTDSDTGYSVGDNGTILKTNDGGGFFVGLNDLSPKSNQIKIYPDPASNQITIETSETAANSQLSIMNLNGEEVLTHSIIKPKTQIDISNLPSGIYFVRMTNDRNVEVGKFVKQ
jgi:hypothetical protein